MKEIRLNGVVLRPTSRGWQVGEAAMRNRAGVRVEHLVRIKHYSHDDLPRAVANFVGRSAAESEADSILALCIEMDRTVKSLTGIKPRSTRRRKPDGKRIYLRVSPDHDALISRAAHLAQVTPTEFVRGVAVAAALQRTQ